MLDQAMVNQSDVFEFTLIGFPGLAQKYHILVSILLFMVYIMTLLANGSVIALVILNQHLHHPMYMIIANLAFSDLLFDTITLPKIIAKYWFGAGSMSFSACMFQLFFVHYLGSVDSFILMLMAIDRLVAIDKPLRYSTIIPTKRAGILCGFLWVCATFTPSTNAIWHSLFPYCGSRKINNLFCVNMAVMGLACGDITLLKKTIFVLSIGVLILPLSFIILSYIIIIRRISVSSQSESWEKAFYTCTTHLFIIAMYYVPRVFVYVAYQVNLVLSTDMSVLLLCLYTFLPHMANPIIYCLRTKEIRQTIGKTLRIMLNLKIESSAPTKKC
ncbi:olfactory receptor 1500-like [Ascaphus truei]|uniref:olfactory receptor 1500-like n=1 Tax=Ascaphus truei TaxID=8439 RepID=UPI003F5A2633